MSDAPSVYLPEIFAGRDLSLAHDLIEAHPFGMVIAGGPMIAHLPLLLDRARGQRGSLVGHVARANPIRRSLEAGNPVVAVFRGPHGYVSPGWYTSRDEVPTWNYAVVHAHATPRLLGEDELRASLAAMAAVHERGQPDPWTLDDLTQQTMGELLPAIVGFSLHITSLEAKLKLSQNRRPEDREGALRGLEARGNADLVALMRRCAPGSGRPPAE